MEVKKSMYLLQWLLQAKNTAKFLKQALEDIEKVSIAQQEIGEGPKRLNRTGIDVITEKAILGDFMKKNQSVYQGIQLEIVEDDTIPYEETTSSFNDTYSVSSSSMTTSQILSTTFPPTTTDNNEENATESSNTRAIVKMQVNRVYIISILQFCQMLYM